MAPRSAICGVLVPEAQTKKQDGLVGVALLEALAGQFIYFSESYVHSRLIQARRIGGPGRG